MKTTTAGITLLGLGPGAWEHLTQEAVSILNGAAEIYLRTRQHPVVRQLDAKIRLESFDAYYEAAENFEDVYRQIVEKILELGKRPGGVIYAVPGHPFIAEATGPEIYRRAKAEGLPVRVVSGLSFIEPVSTVLGIDPFPRITLVDALELANAHYPSFPPDAPALIAQLYSREITAFTKLTLMAVYPDEHPVKLVHAAGTGAERVEELKLYEIDRSQAIGLMSVLYVPPLGEGSSLESFAGIVAHLRAPDGCPWDRKQTLHSLHSHLLEETYEAIEAIEQGNMPDLQEELGDLLLMVLMLTQIASEEAGFNFTDVVSGIYTKIVRRHPHVFGGLDLKDEAGVLANWEKLKEAEREINGTPGKGILDGVVNSLPALLQAQEIQERVAHVGFDWPEIQGVWAKVQEELEELQDSHSPEERMAEFGDVLFALVNLARHLDVNAEAALRQANQRFRSRFKHIELSGKQQGKKLTEMTLDEMESLWQEAKSRGESG
jgi:tetrapyrrole methylase family protein/MazG family protein